MQAAKKIGPGSCERALTWAFVGERVTGIEPALSAWEADVLPLNYTRAPARRGRGHHTKPRQQPCALADEVTTPSFATPVPGWPTDGHHVSPSGKHYS